MDSKDAIAFVGLGQMGYRMAGNLRKKMPPSATLYVNDINKVATERFTYEFGGCGPIHVAETAREAASQAKTVVSIVTAAPHVKAVYLDPESGVINAPKDQERLILECSTIDLDSTREVKARLTEAGVGLFVDAPVSGGIKGAAEANLSFLVGYTGPLDVNPVTRRIFDIITTMGKGEKVIFCGDFSTGLAAKIANNYVACSNMVILAEAFAMGIANGVDRKILYDCIHNSSGDSWSLNYAQPVPGIVPGPASNKYEPSFLMPMIVKDVTLGVNMARSGKTACGMGETSLGIFKAANEDPRCKNKDCTSVWLHVSDCAFDPEFNLEEVSN